MSLSVVVVDDQTVFREMLVEILDADPRYQVLAQFGSGSEVRKMLPKLAPDLLILDAVLSDESGIDALRAVRDQLRRTRILLVTAHEKVEVVQDALEAGAHGVVVKGAALSELKHAVEHVASGGTYFCATAAELLRQGVRSRATSVKLTLRERQVLQLVARGMSSKEIAQELGLTEKTVANHRMHIRDKLNLRDVASITRYAIERGWVEPRS
jgi:DNA-binding NarL/FixJ family response regulator